MKTQPFDLIKCQAKEPMITSINYLTVIDVFFSSEYTLIITVLENGQVMIFNYSGQQIDGINVLLMVQKVIKKSGWINIHPRLNNDDPRRCFIYDTKEQADRVVSKRTASMEIIWNE